MSSYLFFKKFKRIDLVLQVFYCIKVQLNLRQKFQKSKKYNQC